jgi:hypothetical protein
MSIKINKLIVFFLVALYYKTWAKLISSYGKQGIRITDKISLFMPPSTNIVLSIFYSMAVATNDINSRTNYA